MPIVQLPGGFVMHVKMAKQPRRRCSAGQRHGQRCTQWANYQCDYPKGNGRTCSAWICGHHITIVGPDLHHCPTHAHRQAGLFTSLMEQPQ